MPMIGRGGVSTGPRHFIFHVMYHCTKPEELSKWFHNDNSVKYQNFFYLILVLGKRYGLCLPAKKAFVVRCTMDL